MAGAVGEATTSGAAEARIEELEREVRRLRDEVRTSRVVSARALSRATRLAQLISVIGQLTDLNDILERSACEVAEQYFTDIAAFLIRHEDDGRIEVAACWGISNSDLLATLDPVPPEVAAALPAAAVTAGPVSGVPVPGWLEAAGPQHVAWCRLAVPGEHLGYLLLARRADEPFEPTDFQELGIVANRLALAIENGRLNGRAREQLRRLQRLHELTSQLTSTVDLHEVVRTLAELLVDEVPLSGAAVYLASDRSHQLAFRAGMIGVAPLHLASDAPAPTDLTRVTLDSGEDTIGSLLVAGAPRHGTEAGTFLEHLADLGGLAIEKAQLFGRLRHQAETDALTGLANRALLLERLDGACRRGLELGTDVTIVFLDLDRFKAVNDTYGHAAGDELLIGVANRLREVVRPADTVARLGGDEFVVMCEDITPTDSALLADRIEQVMAAPFELGAKVASVGCSIGISMASSADHDPSLILRWADENMYRAKHGELKH